VIYDDRQTSESRNLIKSAFHVRRQACTILEPSIPMAISPIESEFWVLALICVLRDSTSRDGNVHLPSQSDAVFFKSLLSLTSLHFVSNGPTLHISVLIRCPVKEFSPCRDLDFRKVFDKNTGLVVSSSRILPTG
jgi:hypothetical protein